MNQHTQDESFVFIPLVTKQVGTDCLIEGPISSEMVDLDGQIVDNTWLKGALPQWMVYGNIREQHDFNKAVGKALSLNMDHPVGPSILAKITDADCRQKVMDRVYSGFSLGIKGAKIIRDALAPRGRIVGGEIFEVSVVDHPSVRKAAFNLVTKTAGGWKDHQSGITYEDVVTKHISTEERDSLPDDRFAGPHRSFPIDDQDDVDSAAHLIGHADDPEEVKRHIIALAKEEHLHPPKAWDKNKDKKKMPEDEDVLYKGSASHTKDEKEDSKKDFREEDGEEDEDGEDYVCPKCHKDAADCKCYSVRKAAADFEGEHDNPRPLKPGHPDMGGSDKPGHAFTAMYEGPEGQHAMYTGADARVRLDYIQSRADHLFDRMEKALSKMEGNSVFNPNCDYKDDGKDTPKNDPNHGMGGTPDSDQEWHGHTATTTNMEHKSPAFSLDDVYKVAADVSLAAIQSVLLDNGIITKGAGSNPTKAALVELVKSVAADVAYEAFDQLEQRLARVEQTPLPQKGIAAVPQVQPHFQETYPTLQKSVMENALDQALASMSDDQKSQLTARYIMQDWSRQYQPQQ